MDKHWKRAALAILVICPVGCAANAPRNAVAPVPTPELQAMAPKPIEGNTGEYLCPYTSDGTIAEWVDMGTKASVGGSLGGAVGQQAGQKAAEQISSQIPVLGSLFGRKAGEKLGRETAIKLCGGWDKIRESSDLSFDSLDEMSFYLFAFHSTEPDFNKVFQLSCKIYPDLAQTYPRAINRILASRS